jgi:hypothetical protein
VVFTVSVDTVLPVDVTVAGEKLHVALLGRPEQVNATVAVGLKPFCGVNVTVSVPPLPAITASDDAETPSVKSGVDEGAPTEVVVALDWLEAVDAPSSSTASTT